MSLAFIASELPYFGVYSAVFSAFGFPAFHLVGVAEPARTAVARAPATPFSLYGGLASWTAQAQLMRWLENAAGPRTEGLP